MHVGSVDIRGRHKSFSDVANSRQNVHHHSNVLAASRKLRSGVLIDQILLAAIHIHTHTRLKALFPGLPGWAGTRKVKPIWILLEQETVSGSGTSWAICKSAICSRQITTPAPHHSFFTGWMPFLLSNQQHHTVRQQQPYKIVKLFLSLIGPKGGTDLHLAIVTLEMIGGDAFWAVWSASNAFRCLSTNCLWAALISIYAALGQAPEERMGYPVI